MRKSRLHVLVLAQIYPPDMAGSATRALNIAKGLLSNNARVTVVASVPHYPDGKIPPVYRWRPIVVEDMLGVRLIRTFVPPLKSSGFGRRLILFLSFIVSSLLALPLVQKVDVVFGSNPQTLVAFPGEVFSWLHKCPLVLNVDDLWPESLYDLGMLKSPLGKMVGEAVARIAFSLPRLVTPISIGYAGTLVRKYGVSPSIIKLVPGGVDLKMFPEQEAQAKKGGFEVLYIGAFSSAYDFEQVMRAAKLLEREPKIRFVFQGSGEESSNMKAFVKELNLANVSVRDWVVTREEAARMMVNADALVVPLAGTRNIEQGFSSKVYEYQAAGKPIICCSRGRVGDYVAETHSGIVVEPGDYYAIAETTLMLCENRTLAFELGKNGRSIVAERYSIEAIGRDILGAINALVPTHGKLRRDAPEG